MKRNDITIYEYLAVNVPNESHEVINTLGRYKRAKDSLELVSQLKHFVRNHKEDGLKALAEIHPDRELLEMNCKSCKNLQEKNIEYSNIIGDKKNTEEKKPKVNDNEDKLSLSKMAFFGGFMLIALALITKK
ncbi:MAG: hypothetical protein ABF244_00580 [Flavobacteriaceae bacterium]